jgi:flavin-dependent dehydrogenase
MKNRQIRYDVAIIGGGLAGLALAIQLARKNFSVVLFEKEKYPFHKVCGEYISMESWDFLESLGLPLSDLDLPIIDTLNLTAPNGKSFTTKLPLGGFGISRYKIDSLLYAIAKDCGVAVLEEAKVENVRFEENKFYVQYFQLNKGSKEIEAIICCGAYGKRSNLDVKWKRDFISKTDPRINNYVAVKYHVKTNWPNKVIGLHNFKDGYCGISQIEEKKYCLCYLTTAANLRKSGNSITRMQEEILFANPVLKNVFSSSDFFFESPLTISQISFSKKTLVENNLLMLGDSAGMIAPLCGNGMSMALHSSKLAANCADLFLKRKTDRREMEECFTRQWKKEFSGRMRMGRILQSFFGSAVLSNLFVTGFKTFPFLAKRIINKTHGKAF